MLAKTSFKKHIVLVHFSFSVTKIVPIGLLYVGGSLRRQGYSVNLCNYFTLYQKINLYQIANEIIKQEPLFVGFSVRTDAVDLSLSLSRILKTMKPDLPILWGGIHPTLLPEQTLQDESVGFVIAGDGEAAIVQFAEAIENGKSGFSSIKGLGYKEGYKEKSLRYNGMADFIYDLDSYPPDYSLLNLNDYFDDTRSLRRLPVVTSRGCPYRCGFCYNSTVNMKNQKIQIRAHSADFCVDMIKRLSKEYNINYVQYYDDNFFIWPERAFEILERLLMTSWLELTIHRLKKPELVQRLIDCKVDTILFGWESGNDRILKMINKGITTDDILEAAHNLKKFPQLHISPSAIVCYPTETKEEIKNTFRFSAELSRIMRFVSTGIGTYIPYPGTPLYNLAKKEGYVAPNSLAEWMNFSVIRRYDVDAMQILWLPWITGSYKKKLGYGYKYVKYCSRYYEKIIKERYEKFEKTIIKRLLFFLGITAVKIFYRLFWLRIRYSIFSFPIDLMLFESVQKLYRRLK